MRFDRAKVILFVCALAARLILPTVGFPATVSDSGTYLSAARGLVSGAGLVDESGRPTAFRPPTYPFFLAGMLVLAGGSLVGVQVIQALLSALLAPLVMELLEARAGRRRALIAGWILALDPVSIPPSAYILTEAIGSALILLWLAAWSRADRDGRPRFYAWAGLLGGTMIYQTMITLLLHPLAMSLRVLRRPSTWRRALVSAFIFAIPFTAWTYRNKLVLGEGTAVRSGGFGFLLWSSANYDFPWLLSPYDERGDHIFRQEKRVQARLDAQAAHRVYMRKAIARIRAEPLAFAARAAKGAFWSWVEVPGAMKSLDRYPLIRWGLRGANALIILLAILGAPRAMRTREGRIAIGTILYFTFFHAPLYPIPRYFIPIRPLLAVLSAFAAPFGVLTGRART
jgi:hypothetical protein